MLGKAIVRCKGESDVWKDGWIAYATKQGHKSLQAFKENRKELIQNEHVCFM